MEIVNNFLLLGAKFMSEMNLSQPRFIYSACGPFTKNKKRIKKNLKKQDIFLKTPRQRLLSPQYGLWRF